VRGMRSRGNNATTRSCGSGKNANAGAEEEGKAGGDGEGEDEEDGVFLMRKIPPFINSRQVSYGEEESHVQG